MDKVKRLQASAGDSFAARASSGNEADQLLQQAVELHRSSKLIEAIGTYKKVLDLQPKSDHCHYFLGLAYHQNGELIAAIESIRKAIEINPSLAERHCNLGVILSQTQNYLEAFESLDRAILLKPSFAEAYNIRGATYQILGQPEKALPDLRKAIDIMPNFSLAYSNLAYTLKELGHLQEALTCSDKAISIQPDLPDAHNNRGVILSELQRHQEAIASFDRAIMARREFADAYCNRGNVLRDMGRLEDALESYSSAIAFKPNDADAFNNRGAVLKSLNRHPEALEDFSTSISLNPAQVNAYNNRGIVLLESHNQEEALRDFKQALSEYGDQTETLWNLSLAYLLVGDFENGLPLYEHRWKNKSLKLKSRAFREPLWLGKESLDGKIIFVHSEQGLGDTIQFCRYGSLLKNLGASVIVEIPHPLLEVLQGISGVDLVVKPGDPIPQFDYQCPMLSLPYALNTRVESIPNNIPYIQSTKYLREAWRDRLGEKETVRIGLAWSGNRENQNDRNRSISLELLLPFLPAECEYFCLQRDVRDSDWKVLKDSRINFFGDEMTFPMTAALIDHLDLVVTVDTSIAHLSGALGRPTWLLLSAVPDWRWMLSGAETPWYPTMRLYRQGLDRSWEKLLARVGSDLKSLSRPLFA